MKGAIIYKSKYGATRDYAGLLAQELSLPLFAGDVPKEQLARFDYLLIGSPVYIGKLPLKEWLAVNESWLKQKKLLFFIVCGTPAEQHEKTSRIIADNIPGSLHGNPVYFLHGRMTMKKLSWKDRLLLRLGAWLTRDPREKKQMLQDFDNVRPANLRGIVEAAHHLELAVVHP